MKKLELRKIYLTRQKSFSDEERNERTRQISDELFGGFDLNTIRFLHVFLPIEKNGEIETPLLIARLRREHPQITVAVPRVDFETMTLEHAKLSIAEKTVVNRWGISEPHGSETIAALRLDVVLVPLLCFDVNGFRVGYGKGFYDRFLKNCRPDCLKIGLSYFEQVTEITDAQNFDVKLDFCVTPFGVSVFK